MNEFNSVIHNEYNSLVIKENLGHLERIVSLLKDLSKIGSRCFFFSQCHGGFVSIGVASYYDSVYLLNNLVLHENNIKTNITNFGVLNAKWDWGSVDACENMIVYSEKYEDIDSEFIQKYSPIVLTNLTQKLLKSGLYSNIYELSNSNLALYIPDRLNEEFLKEFHYYIDSEKLIYDNLIHLCIMVKNGGKQFETMLTENAKFIDRWTILDTGSTDETVEIINRVLVGKKKGYLFQEPFINFRDSRNRLLELAGDTCKFTLMLDDTYIVNGDLREFLNEIRGDQVADSFTVFIKSDDVEYGSNRILKTDRKLRYLFKIHEVVQENDNMNIVVPINRTHIIDGRFEYMEKRTMDRKRDDLKLLYEEVEDDPNNPRSFYYLGQTYNLLEEYDKAYFYFLKRANHVVEGFLQEKIDATFEAARIANFKLNKPWSECEELYLKAYNLDKSRPDSLYFLGIHHHLNGNKMLAYDCFKRGFVVGYPVHCQYSLKPTISFHYLPKFLSQLCYEFQDFNLGEKCCKLFLDKNDSSSDMYNVMLSWYNIFVKLNLMNNNAGSFHFVDFLKTNEKPLLCFVADGGFGPWTGSDINSKGVGGSETYIIEMARYIQKQGNFKVIVFCNCHSYSIFEDVEYIPIENYPPFSKEVNVHTCVISRFSEYIPVAINGKVDNVYLVLHDLGPSGLVIPQHEKLKKIFCLTEWHVEYFLKTFPSFKEITVPFYYGVDISKFNNETKLPYSESFEGKSNISIDIVESINKIPYKFIYSSFPNRGLLQLLQMWPRIIDKYPYANLHIYSDINGKWVNDFSGDMMTQIRDLLKKYAEKESEDSKKLNIFYYGWVNKTVLAESWKTSEYWFYPCTFMETFCLTALEAALTKTLAITNGLAALQNTVGDRGLCIPGDATDAAWQDRALEELFFIMSEDGKKTRDRMVEENYNWALNLSWEKQAKRLENVFL